MVIRNAAVRHGRRQLAAPVGRSVLLRHLTTATATPTTQAWPGAPTEQPPSPPKLFSASKKKQRRDNASISLSTNTGHEHHGPQWTRSHQGRTPKQQYAEFERVQRATRATGTLLERRYVPSELIAHPPAPEDVSLELLLASQTHMGHNTSLWNPANARYIYGARQGIHIISLEATAAHLRRAARVVEDVAYRGGLVLFVGNRPGQMEIVTRAAELARACHLYTKWIPGSITNRDVILKNKGVKVVDGKDGELEGFDGYKNSARPLVPDLVVCLNPTENYTLLYECGLASVPTIGVIDTNANPTWVSYTIPANDDSLRSIAVIGGVLARAGQRGQERRLADAKNGNVTWQTPPSLASQIKRDIKVAVNQRKEVMGRMQANLVGFTEEELEILQTEYDGAAKSVSEADMVNMMAEASVQETAEEDAPAADLASDIAARLDQAKGHASALEAEIAEIRK
ncbi:37S ribosomal protein MRP4 [Cordyceps militaris CM01]|uniref:37S ribosomal protein MRP4 n=1 Tax=Cordyceps militaris (strain CM01) TaxID=983644 RepID=G3J466_CORMM|nr:37S ribosomal protein MRP4 [Cordyceps militaris CM01]EGX96637.1 37S ribosomal protein MRP4 [Cordyceps militaris CM01]